MQLANYILWSLVLAVLHVCACAIMWKLATLTETKPWPVLQLLFVKCMRLAFWQQLFKCGSLFRTSSAPLEVNYHQANSSSANTPGTECVQLPGGHASDSSCNDEKITPTKVTTKAAGDGEEIDKEKLPVEENEPNTWMEVSFGVNRLITVAYLLVNALAFAFYLCPLLYRIIRHYSVVDYVNDIGEYAI